MNNTINNKNIIININLYNKYKKRIMQNYNLLIL